MSQVVQLFNTNSAVRFEIWFRSAVDEQADAVIEGIETLVRARELAEENIQQHGFNVANIIGYSKDGRVVYDVNMQRSEEPISQGDRHQRR